MAMHTPAPSSMLCPLHRVQVHCLSSLERGVGSYQYWEGSLRSSWPFVAELAFQCGTAGATAHELRHLLRGSTAPGRLFLGAVRL